MDKYKIVGIKDILIGFAYLLIFITILFLIWKEILLGHMVRFLIVPFCIFALSFIGFFLGLKNFSNLSKEKYYKQGENFFNLNIVLFAVALVLILIGFFIPNAA